MVGRKSSIWAPFILMGVLLLEFQWGCGMAPAHKPVTKDGKTYGVTSGSFRGRWWNFYERGISFADGQFWKEAEADFRVALRLRNEDRRRARTYGMHFIDYFPHRELGAVLFHQGRYEEAIRELETSLKTEKSAKAEFYLDCTRKSLIQQHHSDVLPPGIAVNSPDPDTLSNGSASMVTGVVRDDSYVKSVQVNGIPVRVDLAVREVPFGIRVPLRAGENLIQVVAVDLSGKTSIAERKVYCDRQGPVLSIDEPVEGAPSRSGPLRLRGYVHDTSGLKEIRVNGRSMLSDPVQETRLDYTLDEVEKPERLVVEALDMAGNQTRAEIDLSKVSDRSLQTSRRVLLASLEIPLLAAASSSEPSNEQEKEPGPVLELRSWTDRQTVFVDQIYLEGSARNEGEIEALAINGQSVLKRPARSVFFNHLAELNEGENVFKIEAKDTAGKRTEKEVRIHRKLQKVRELGSRLTVALLPLERKGVSGLGSDTVEEMLLGSLVERERFEVVERQRLEEILREQKLSRSELADQSAAIRVGKIAVANCVLMGSTIEKEGSLEIYARLVDTETSIILAAVDVYGEDTDPEALRKLSQGLILKLSDECPLVEGMVVQIKGSRIIVDLGKENHIKKGMRLIIFDEGEPIRHPVTGAVLGSDVEELGRALVKAVHPQMSEVELVGNDPLERLKPAHKVITQ